MSEPFNAVYNPDYAEAFNPKAIGTLVDPCVTNNPLNRRSTLIGLAELSVSRTLPICLVSKGAALL